MELLQNAALCLLFAVSGAVIIKALDKMNMRVAKLIAMPVFGVLLLYIPFYFGGNQALYLMRRVVDSLVMQALERDMNYTLRSPFPYVEVIAFLSAAFAVLLGTLAVMVTVYAANAVIEVVKEIVERFYTLAPRYRTFTLLRKQFHSIQIPRRVYLELERLLN